MKLVNHYTIDTSLRAYHREDEWQQVPSKWIGPVMIAVKETVGNEAILVEQFPTERGNTVSVVAPNLVGEYWAKFDDSKGAFLAHIYPLCNFDCPKEQPPYETIVEMLDRANYEISDQFEGGIVLCLM